jgi:hypothetical protein
MEGKSSARMSPTGLTLGARAWDMDRVRAEPFKVMLGFVVRQCAVALGHAPTPGEFARWANEQRDARGRYRIFGHPISDHDAAVMLRHPGRLVTVRPGPRWVFGAVATR